MPSLRSSFAFRPKHVAFALLPASFRRIPPVWPDARVRCATSSPVRCSPFGLCSACGFRECPCIRPDARYQCVEAAPKSRFNRTVIKGEIMNATTTHTINTTNTARLSPSRSPEAHQRAGFAGALRVVVMNGSRIEWQNIRVTPTR